MLTAIEVTSDQGATLSLFLQQITEGYIIQEVDGLDPVKATIVSSSFAQMDGAQYQSSRRETRNIVLKLGLAPDYYTSTVRELRNRLYNYFMPKTRVSLRFMIDGELDSVITGRVETFDAPLFVKDPTVTISLLCFDPDFYNPDPVVLSGMTTSDSTEFLVNYDGTAETGIQLHLDIDRDLPEFTVYHRPADDTLRTMEFIAPLSAGDILDISTISGAKGAILTRAGSASSILYGVSPYSNWINLFPGPNYLRVYAEGVGIPYTITYNTKLGGL